MAIIKTSGGGSSVALSDATPTDVTSAAASAGVGTLATRDDHRHGGPGFATSDQVSPITTGTASLTFGTNITPGTVPNGQGSAVAFANDGSAIAVGHATSPYLSVYQWDGVAFGSRVQPSTGLVGGAPGEVKFSPDNDFIAVFGPASNSESFAIYPWDGSAVGAGVQAPVIVPITQGGDWSPSGGHVAVAESASGARVYSWNGTTIGTPVAQTVAGEARDVSFSPDGNYIAIAHDSSPYVSVYNWTGSAFGTKVSDPATLPTALTNGADWSKDGTKLIVTYNASPFIRTYEWTGSGFGANDDASGTLPSSAPNDGEFSDSGAYIAMALSATPYVQVRPVLQSGGLGDAISPSALPGLGWDLSFSPDGLHLAVAHTTTPYVTVIPGDRVIGF